MIVPPPAARSDGTVVLAVIHTPVRSISTIERHCVEREVERRRQSAERSPRSRRRCRDDRSARRSRRRRVASRRGRSRRRERQAPTPPDAVIRAATSCERFGAPSGDCDRRAGRGEHARRSTAPMPVPPPVINATLPSRSPTARLLCRERLHVSEPVLLSLVPDRGPERLRGCFVCEDDEVEAARPFARSRRSPSSTSCPAMPCRRSAGQDREAVHRAAPAVPRPRSPCRRSCRRRRRRAATTRGRRRAARRLRRRRRSRSARRSPPPRTRAPRGCPSVAGRGADGDHFEPAECTGG